MKKQYHTGSGTLMFVILVLSTLFTLSPTYYFPLIFKNSPPPLYSSSYYIQNGDPAKMYDFGCRLGQRDAATTGTQDSLVILDFGKMWISGNLIGVKTFSDPTNGYNRTFLTFGTMEEFLRQFATGFWQCSGNDRTSQLTLAAGTNSFDYFGPYSSDQDNLRGIMNDFGRNWAYMVNRLNAWAVSNSYNQKVLFAGAIDIEWAGADPADQIFYWQSPYVVRGWVDAFDLADNDVGIFFNYGACVGCPTVPNLTWKYTAGLPWTQSDAWYVSWGSKPAFSVPEIYANNGVNARQWAAVSKFGALYNASRIVFTGAMTQMQACVQRGGSDTTCALLDNTPAQGWGQLLDAVNVDTATTLPTIPYSTDIGWQFK